MSDLLSVTEMKTMYNLNNQVMYKINCCMAGLFLMFIGCLFSAACSDNTDEVLPPDNPGDWITLSSTEALNFAYEGGHEEVAYTLGEGIQESGLELTLSSDGDDWITATAQGGILSIRCERSYRDRSRSTTLTIGYGEEKNTCRISINQAKSESTEDQLIRVTGATASSEETSNKDSRGNPLTLPSSYDKDPLTFYNSKYGIVSYPFEIMYELESGRTLSRIVYTPRQEWNYLGCFNTFKVEYATGDAPDAFTLIGEYTMGDTKGENDELYTTTPFHITLETPVENVKKVRFTITKAYMDRVSVAEMEFFEPAKNKFSYSDIFADDMGLVLKEGLTEKYLLQVPNENLKEAALTMLRGEYDAEFRHDTFRPFQHPSVMANKNKTAKYSLRDNPTGIYVRNGDQLPVFVKGLPEGRTVSLLIQDLTQGYGSGSKTYALKEGYNEITCNGGGLVYVINHIDDDIPLPAAMDKATPAQQRLIEENSVEIHFCGARVSGYFDLLKHTPEDWDRILDMAIASSYGYIDIVGKYAHITWEARQYKDNNYRKQHPTEVLGGSTVPDDGYTDKDEIVQLLNLYDDMVYDQQDFAGLVKYHRMFNNRLHFCMDQTAGSPNASDYRTVYPCKIESPHGAEMFFNPLAFPTRLWGPCHEAGHVNQLRPGLRWSGLTEVTNNLYCLYVQEQNGVPCKLQVDKITPKDESGNSLVNEIIYDAAIHLIVDGKRPHSLPGITSGHMETKLVPFWQLYLYFVKTGRQPDFYKDLCEHFRNYPSPSQNGGTAGQDQLDFVRQTCAISRTNLLDFFEKWGFLRACNGSLNDYGNKDFVIEQDEIEALKAEIEGKGYTVPANAEDIYQITDNTWENYK